MSLLMSLMQHNSPFSSHSSPPHVPHSSSQHASPLEDSIPTTPSVLGHVISGSMTASQESPSLLLEEESLDSGAAVSS